MRSGPALKEATPSETGSVHRCCRRLNGAGARLPVRTRGLIGFAPFCLTQKWAAEKPPLEFLLRRAYCRSELTGQLIFFVKPRDSPRKKTHKHDMQRRLADTIPGWKPVTHIIEKPFQYLDNSKIVNSNNQPHHNQPEQNKENPSIQFKTGFWFHWLRFIFSCTAPPNPSCITLPEILPSHAGSTCHNTKPRHAHTRECRTNRIVLDVGGHQFAIGLPRTKVLPTRIVRSLIWLGIFTVVIMIGVVRILLVAIAVQVLATEDATRLMVMLTSGSFGCLLVGITQHLRDDAALCLLLTNAELVRDNYGPSV